MKHLINDLLDLPYVGLLSKGLKNALKKEKERRKTFFNHQYDKAEFINGELVIPSPLNKKALLAKDAILVTLKNLLNTPEWHIFDENPIVLTRNVYQSPISVFKQENIKKIKNNKFVFGTPDLVVEMVDNFSEYYIREIKMRDLEEHGIAEYWIIDAETQQIDQFALKDGKYEHLRKDDKNLKSRFLKDFSLSIKTIFKGRSKKVENNISQQTDEKEFY